jgi:hypothetical protein
MGDRPREPRRVAAGEADAQLQQRLAAMEAERHQDSAAGT